MTSSKRQAVKAAREYADSIVHSGHEMNRSCYLAHLAGQESAQAQMEGRVKELETVLKQAKEYLFNQSFNQRTIAAKCDEALSGAGKGE